MAAIVTADATWLLDVASSRLISMKDRKCLTVKQGNKVMQDEAGTHTPYVVWRCSLREVIGWSRNARGRYELVAS